MYVYNEYWQIGQGYSSISFKHINAFEEKDFRNLTPLKAKQNIHACGLGEDFYFRRNISP
jgi:hypothetical protein